MKTLINRMTGKTPKFFRRIRNMAIVLAAISGALYTSDVAGPVIQTIASYLGLASTVLIAAAQAAVTTDTE